MRSPKEILQTPNRIANATQTAVIVSCIALVLAGIAVIAATRRTGGEN